MNKNRPVSQIPSPTPTKTLPSSAQSSFSFTPRRRSRAQSEAESLLAVGSGPAPGKIPRISRLMALAIKFDGLIRQGVVADYADLARLGFVSRARITQIMGLLNLVPDIQEELLFLPRTLAGHDPVVETHVREICKVDVWERQRDVWTRPWGNE